MAKVKHIWSILCKRSIIDSDSNNLTLSDILEQINIDLAQNTNASNPINIPFDCEIVTMWAKEEMKVTEGEYKIEFLDPKKMQIKEHVLSFKIPHNVKRLRTRVKLNGLSVKGSGIYYFKVYLKEKMNTNFSEVSEIPLEILISDTAKVLN